MRVDDLDHEELLELDPDGGVIRFAGQRALLLDAVAMGLLRKYLVENFGLTAARTVLTQFGFAHGWRMAEAMQAAFKWDSDEDWRRAGPRIHTQPVAGLPLIHVRHEFASDAAPFFRPGTPGADIHASVTPAEGETVITKQAVNAFQGTDL